jgi:hypothetical protein
LPLLQRRRRSSRPGFFEHFLPDFFENNVESPPSVPTGPHSVPSYLLQNVVLPHPVHPSSSSKETHCQCCTSSSRKLRKVLTRNACRFILQIYSHKTVVNHLVFVRVTAPRRGDRRDPNPTSDDGNLKPKLSELAWPVSEPERSQSTSNPTRRHFLVATWNHFAWMGLPNLP